MCNFPELSCWILSKCQKTVKVGILVFLDVTEMPFCLDMAQFPPVKTNINVLILENLGGYAVIFSNVFFIDTGFPFFMVLQFDVAAYVVLFQVKKIFLLQ